MHSKSIIVRLLSIFVILTTILSSINLPTASAQQGKDGINRKLNAETGKVSFIGPESGRSLSYSQAMGLLPGTSFSRPADPAMALAKRFAPEFGIRDASKELSAMKTNKPGNGRVTVKYQQKYQGVPVMAGELIVNTNEYGDLYSINGEVSPNLSISTEPKITSDEAKQIALEAMAKWNQKAPEEFIATQPELWIFDESLLQPSTRPAELVWRMDVSSADGSLPIRELMLINAQTGNPDFHFNQIDTEWGLTGSAGLVDDPDPTPTALATETPLPTETALATPTMETTDSNPVFSAAAAGDVTTLSGATWYVATTGTDSGPCNQATPCQSIQKAINLAAAGDTILVADGTYYRPASLNTNPNVVIINKALTISGGWKNNFSEQTGVSIVDGQSVNNGILLTGGTVSIDRFMVQASTSGDGGGIYNSSTNLTLTNSTVKNNHAGNGPVFLIGNASLSLVNVTISGNTATNGGGIYVVSPTTGTVNIKYSTIAYNSASASGGGVYLSTTGTTITDSIISNNTAPTGPDCYGKINITNHNIIGNKTGCTVTAGTGDKFNVSPQLNSTLAGIPAVHALLVGGPAVDAANSSTCPAKDEVGMPRPQGAGCDMGAYELPSPGIPVSIAVSSGNNQQKQVNQAFDNPLVALVLDAYGNPVNNASVTFTAPASGASGTFAGTGNNAETVPTNESGMATSSVFTANNVVGSYTVTASVTGVGTTASFSMENKIQGGIPTSIVFISGGNQQTPINTPYADPLKVKILDGYGDPVSGANVTFTAWNGASLTFAGSGTALETVSTDGSGIATTSTMTANGTTGTVHVNITVSGIASSPYFVLQNLATPGLPTSITYVSGSNQQTQVNQSFTLPFKAVVKDGNGVPVSNVSVTFTAPASGASGTFASTGTQMETVLTDSSGYATSSVFTVNGTAGSYNVYASTSGVANQPVYQLQNRPAPGTPWSILVISGNNQQALATQSFASPLSVRVLDYYGAPIVGINVTFTAPPSGASGTFASSDINTETIVTNATGYATSSTFTAGSLFGTYTVYASVPGLAYSAPFTLANLGTRYVKSATDGGIDSGGCSVPTSACATIKYALSQSSTGDTIKVAVGTYTNSVDTAVVIITKNITILGGWDSTFASQTGYSTLDGQNVRRGLLIDSFTATIERIIIENGYYASSGAGIYDHGNLTLNQSIVRNNSGDGIYQEGYLALNRTSVHHNTGSGIYNFSGNLNLNNTTITKNSRAGVDLIYGGAININNSTITENTGGGIYKGSSFASVYLKNTIIANNTVFGIMQDCYGSIYSQGNNLIKTPTSSCTINNASNEKIGVDPLLGYFIPLNGYYTLKAGSPALDAGNPATCLSTDQRGAARPYGSKCDIGAFERFTVTGTPDLMLISSGNNQRTAPKLAFSQPLTVYLLSSAGDVVSGVNVTFTAPDTGASGIFTDTETNTTSTVSDQDGVATTSVIKANTILGNYNVIATADGVNSVTFDLRNINLFVSRSGQDSSDCTSPTQPCFSINYAIGKAISGDVILVTGEIYNNAPINGNLVNITNKNIVLSGGWDQTFTTQNGQTILKPVSGRGVYVDPASTVSMDRFDVTGGKVANTLGGGILNSGSLTFTNGAIDNNSAHSGNTINFTASDGGGIYSSGTLLTLSNVTISNNDADTGGGLFVYNSNTTLNNVTITQNFATNAMVTAYGGGIRNKNNAPIIIKNTLIAGNSAEVGQDCSGQIISGGNNAIGFNGDCTFTSLPSDLIGTQFMPLNMKLGNLSDNNSSTKTHALLSGSPAIDAGNPATCTPVDQRGVARPQGAICDIGAFEGSSEQTIMVYAKTYSAGNSPSWPGIFRCDSSTLTCTNGSDPAADTAQHFAIGTYNFYASKFGRNGIDQNNMPVISTVHYCSEDYCPYANAFWSGAQMVYGDGLGYANADDVVGHELTHGVTQYESNLFYFYQSGAINESFSDIFGEYFDQTNGEGSDGANVKWLVGEDITGRGASRSMSNPPLYGDPDRMTSALYNKQPATDNYWDNGGVHTNSGVNNKAAYLMVDGGAFNNKTITALGWEKVGAIYYEVNTNLLSSGADYSDLYYALQQACTNLIGQHGITSTDCAEVKDAVDAVQMNMEPGAGFNPEATLCPTGMTTTESLSLFKDDFENGTGNWTASSAWRLASIYATSPLQHMWGVDNASYTDASLRNTNGISLPAATTPFLHFKHAFAFEFASTQYYDGAVLEYSTDGGLTWLDSKSLFSGGQNYNGIISSAYGNPLKGRSGFVGDSHGYVSSRYDLTSLAGKTVQFRWRFATDSGYDFYGWFVDDVQVYICIGTPAIPMLKVPATNSLTTNYTPLLDWTDTVPVTHHYQVQVDDNADFSSPVIDDNTLTISQYQVASALPSNTKYYWRVKAYNEINGTNGWSTVWNFRTALLPPDLSSPADNFVSHELRPVFDWSDVPTAIGYVIQISTSNTFTTIAHTGSPVSSYYVPTVDLPKNSTLYWRVQTKGANGPSLFSGYRSFTTPVNPPPAPLLVMPASNFLVTNYKPTFSWKPVVMPTGTTLQNYIIQVDDNADFSSPVVNDSSPVGTSFTPSADLASNTKFYWRVRVVNNLGEMSNWSLVWYFRTALVPPVVTSPANGFASKELRPLFDWEDVPSATGYTIQISTSNTFATITHAGSPVGSYYVPTVDLPKNVTLYWRVQTKGLNGPSAWSATPYWSFTTPVNPPPAPALTLPASNALVINYTPSFTWKAVVPPAGTTIQNYIIQVDDNAAFNNSEVNESTNNTFLTSTVTLASNTKFYWRVRAVNNLGEMSNWSSVWYFRTAILPPTLTVPADNATGVSKMPLLDWSDVPGNTGYVLQVWKAGATPVLVKSVTLTANVSQYQFIANLLPNTAYFWKVQTKAANGPSAWSDQFDFTTGP